MDRTFRWFDNKRNNSICGLHFCNVINFPVRSTVRKKYIANNVYISGVTLDALTGYDGAIDRLHAERKEVFDQFLQNRRPTRRCTPILGASPHFRVLLSSYSKLHTSNMISLT